MKLCIFKTVTNVTEANLCIQSSLCGNISRNFKRFHFVACNVLFNGLKKIM